MSTLKNALQAAVNSEAANERLQTAAGLAGAYLRQRETAAAASAASASFAAEVLGLPAMPAAKASGQMTAKGLEALCRKDPIKTILLAVAKQDRELKLALYWGLDAARRSAAVEAYRASTVAATAEEAASIAGGLLGLEPYAGGDESSLYPEAGYAARAMFEADSTIWGSLALLLSTEADVPVLCRFWTMSGADFAPVNCDAWEDVESFLAKR